MSRDPGPTETMETVAPWLSVLVPAYNVASYVGATLESVLSTPDAGVEVVVYDDGSADGTRRLATRVAATDARVRVVGHEDNRGAAVARTRLLEHARGSYVWFLDADDRLLPGALEALRREVVDGPDLVMCDFRVVGGLRPWRPSRATFDGPTRGVDDVGTLLAGALRAGQLHVWSKIARRALWSHVRFPACRRFEDMAPSLALLAAARSWRYVPQPWVAYRQRAGSLMRTLGVHDLRDYSSALAEVHRIAAACRGSAGAPQLASAVDAFLLRGHSSIARRLDAMGVAADDPTARYCERRFREDLSDRGRAALDDARRHRGRWHARRLARSLDRGGWRVD